MVTMKNLKDMLQIFQEEKKLMNLDGFTLIIFYFFFFTDILNQEFNLREKKNIYNNTLTETINTKNFE